MFNPWDVYTRLNQDASYLCPKPIQDFYQFDYKMATFKW